MKFIFRFVCIATFTLLSIKGISQQIDSAWVAAHSIPKFNIDPGYQLYAFTYTSEKKSNVSLSDYRGKILYISIWTKSCAPCIEQFAHQEQLLKRVKSLQLDTIINFVNINIDDTDKEWRNALKKYHPVGINLHCSDTSIYAKWRFSATPFHALIDVNGKALGLDIEGPSSAGTDWLLYAASKGMQMKDAIWTAYHQEDLMAKHRSVTVLTNSDYAAWFNRIQPLLLEFHQWKIARKNQKTK